MRIAFSAEAASDLERIADLPFGFPLVPRYERHGIRRRLHGNYLIFYRVDGDDIVIIHILHAAMDYAAILIEP